MQGIISRFTYLVCFSLMVAGNGGQTLGQTLGQTGQAEVCGGILKDIKVTWTPMLVSVHKNVTVKIEYTVPKHALGSLFRVNYTVVLADYGPILGGQRKIDCRVAPFKKYCPKGTGKITQTHPIPTSRIPDDATLSLKGELWDASGKLLLCLKATVKILPASKRRQMKLLKAISTPEKL